MYYRVYDNSFCINLENSNYASLVQEHDKWYSPDENEDGALFKPVSEPYIEDIYECGHHYGKKEFINVKSTFTGNIYRVLYNKNSLYNIEMLDIIRLLGEYINSHNDKIAERIYYCLCSIYY